MVIWNGGMEQPWQIELFGWLRATQGDRVVRRFRTLRAGVLLAYLAYHRERSHPREQLIELLWPDSDPRAGRTNLRTELTSLRRQLEPPGVPSGAVLMADRATVQLNPSACVTDVSLFEAALAASQPAADPTERILHLTRAAELYRGELLPGYFEDWVLPERQRLAEGHLQALQALGELLEAHGDLGGAVRWARRAVAVDPLGEKGHHRLIRLLIEGGQVEAAREQYEQAQHRLLRDLGTGLSSQIRALIQERSPAKDRPSLGRVASGRPKPGGSADGGDGWPAGSLVSAASAEHAAASLLAPPSGRTVSPRDNLPLRFTRFVGREAEIEQLHRLLQEPATRLLTMTGPGGTGKTRLAQEAAQGLRETFSGGVWFVSLRDLTDPTLIPDQILLALPVLRSPQSTALEQIVAYLSRAPSLLILDNYEHLVERGAATSQQLLEQVAGLTVLVTSRQRLGLEGEREFPVAPLPVPGDSTHPGTRGAGDSDGTSGKLSDLSSLAGRLSSVPSVGLFVDRAQAARPDFQVTGRNAAAVASLCQRLEGLPLAIELAAARAGVLTPQQMLSRLDQRFELLVARQRAADPRHRSLRATLDWSFNLLTPDLQRFFAQLSVFRGGWTLEAAEMVCEEPRALECLEHLCDCSLVEATEMAGDDSENRELVIRFHLLETLREYSREQAEKEPELLATVADRHEQFFLTYAEARVARMRTRHQVRALEEMEPELDNLRVAIEGASARRHSEHCARLALALYPPLYGQGLWEEARTHLQAGLTALAPPDGDRAALRAALHYHLASLAEDHGDLVEARQHVEVSLALRQGLGEPAPLAETLNLLGKLAINARDFPTACQILADALRVVGDRESIIRGKIVHNLGVLAATQGEVEEARRLYREALAELRRADDPADEARLLGDFGALAHQYERDYGEARRLYLEALAAYRRLRDRHGIAVMLNNLGELAELAGQTETAVALFLHAEAIFRELHSGFVTEPVTSLARMARQWDPEPWAQLCAAAAATPWVDLLLPSGAAETEGA